METDEAMATDDGEPKLCLAVLMGLPAVGKSRLCTRLRSEQSEFHVVHVALDDLVADQSSLKGELKEVRKDKLISVVENVIKSILNNDSNAKDALPTCVASQAKASIQSKILVLVDDNNYYASMRYDFVKVARTHNIGYAQLFIQASVSEALENNDKRPDPQIVPDSVIERMSILLEPPNLVKNGWERFSVAIESKHVASIGLKSILALFNQAIIDPLIVTTDDENEKAQARVESLASLVHQADVCCRKVISSRLQAMRSRLRAEDPEADLKEIMRAESIRLKEQRELYLSNMRQNHEDVVSQDIAVAVTNGDVKALVQLRTLVQKSFTSQLDQNYKNLSSTEQVHIVSFS